jgi:hypothetical protein
VDFTCNLVFVGDEPTAGVITALLLDVRDSGMYFRAEKPQPKRLFCNLNGTHSDPEHERSKADHCRPDLPRFTDRTLYALAIQCASPLLSGIRSLRFCAKSAANGLIFICQ